MSRDAAQLSGIYGGFKVARKEKAHRWNASGAAICNPACARFRRRNTLAQLGNRRAGRGARQAAIPAQLIAEGVGVSHPVDIAFNEGVEGDFASFADGVNNCQRAESIVRYRALRQQIVDRINRRVSYRRYEGGQLGAVDFNGPLVGTEPDHAHRVACRQTEQASAYFVNHAFSHLNPRAASDSAGCLDLVFGAPVGLLGRFNWLATIQKG